MMVEMANHLEAIVLLELFERVQVEKASRSNIEISDDGTPQRKSTKYSAAKSQWSRLYHPSDTVRTADIVLGDIGTKSAEIDAEVTKLIAKMQDKSLDVWEGICAQPDRPRKRGGALDYALRDEEYLNIPPRHMP